MRAPPQIGLHTARAHTFNRLIDGSGNHAIHGDCTNPRLVEMRGVRSLLLSRLERLDQADYYETAHGSLAFVPDKSITMGPSHVLTVIASVRCRKCANCVRQRQRVWFARAIVEIRLAPRTWFGTLTYAPSRRLVRMYKADKETALRRAERLSSLSTSEQFGAIERQCYPDVQRWLKRVRKETGARFRYLVIAEAHKDGFPHYHILLHELTASTVTKRNLQEQWGSIGFSNMRLVDPDGMAGSAGYVCKYLVKEVAARPRASQRYGMPDNGRLTERLREVTHVLNESERTREETPVSERGEKRTKRTATL